MKEQDYFTSTDQTEINAGTNRYTAALSFDNNVMTGWISENSRPLWNIEPSTFLALEF